MNSVTPNTLNIFQRIYLNILWICRTSPEKAEHSSNVKKYLEFKFEQSHVFLCLESMAPLFSISFKRPLILNILLSNIHNTAESGQALKDKALLLLFKPYSFVCISESMVDVSLTALVCHWLVPRHFPSIPAFSSPADPSVFGKLRILE